MSTLDLHPISTNQFATVILPIAVPKPYTYYIPTELIGLVQEGVRVEVQFGKSKLYSAIVLEVHDKVPESHKPKPILNVIDEQAIVHPVQLQLWQWIAKYYSCTAGEVMSAALPAHLKLASETSILLSPLYDENYEGLSDKEFMIAEALSIQNELRLDDVRAILNQKSVYKLIHKLLEKRIIYLKEEIKTKYKPKVVGCVKLTSTYLEEEKKLAEAFDLTKRSEKQERALMAYLQIYKKQEHVRKSELYKLANVDTSVIKALVKKGIFEAYDKEVSRLAGYEEELMDKHDLSEQQLQALAQIDTLFKEKNTLLLHGVTGSGKTRVYIELIQKAMQQDEQVLYLLPEIALTTQIIQRLQKIFGDEIAVYHSRMSNNERVEVWKKVLTGHKVVLGARSSLFLPFKDLKLIIVDEEHDLSYKQLDPAPRYNARDTAIYLAHLHKAKVLLGTATPSVESYHNAQRGKYGLVEMKERFGGLAMPEIVLVDKREELKKQTMQSVFTSVLMNELKLALARGEQAIIFQNRRGHSPTMRCTSCGWHSECRNCDVSLTYHKFHNNLQCHYCGYQQAIPKDCPACGSRTLTLKGFGTEKIEDELQILLPDARIGRMDFDTVRTKNAHARIINEFEEKQLDILVGTQMVTKGLDFENVSVVGVLSADQPLQFPDFRSSERAYQLLTQVSGRAGRKHKQGKVIIQAFDVAHPVIKEVIHHNFTHFFNRELSERRAFFYPPFMRLIKITLKHKKPSVLNKATRIFADFLRSKLQKRLIGPAVPSIPRVRNYYLMDMLIKLERHADVIGFAKQMIAEASHLVHQTEQCSQVRVVVNVDPY